MRGGAPPTTLRARTQRGEVLRVGVVNGGWPRLRAFVLGSASDADLASATGGGVAPLNPTDPFALAMAAEADPAGHVLVVGFAGQEQTVRTLASLAVARWPELRVAWRVTPLGALAAATAAAVAVRAELSPAVAVHYFDSVLGGMWSAAWLPSVSRLHDPAPSLGQHLRSWVPGGSGYLVVHGPATAVLALRSAKTELVVGSSVPSGARYLLLVGGDAPPGVTERVAQLTGTPRVRPVANLVDSRERYGVAQAVEYARLLVPEEAEPERRVVLSGECPACSLPQATSTCPFCHATVRMASRGAT